MEYHASVALLERHLAAEQEQEALQRLSHGLAAHIVGHWPEITVPDRDAAESAARGKLLSMLMTVNPGVQVYLLDADGRVRHYIGEPGMVRQEHVDLAPVRAFLAGTALPLRGTDPLGSVLAADARRPGFLYIVLDGRAGDAVAAQVGAQRLERGVAMAAAVGLSVALLVGLFTFRRLSLPLHQLAQRLRGYSQADGGPEGDSAPARAPRATRRGPSARPSVTSRRNPATRNRHKPAT